VLSRIQVFHLFPSLFSLFLSKTNCRRSPGISARLEVDDKNLYIIEIEALEGEGKQNQHSR
ncbi:hypothetical protein, partial [Anoxybacillus flavithermus]